MTLQRIALSTGVELDVAISGDPANPPVILLHGFPESHRTWRDIAPDLARDHYVIAPDQRGFARSSKPEGIDSYTPDKIVADLIALADHLDIDRFTLVGHDWGGAVAWMAALRHPERIAKLVIINAPHPLVFQRTMFDDLEQRAASQYIRAFRNPDLEKHIESIGLETFFDTSFSKHADLAAMAEDKAAYLDEWGQPGAITGMLNWYRASAIVVPEMDETPPRLPRRTVSADRHAGAGDLGDAGQRAAAEPARPHRICTRPHDREDRRGPFRAVAETRRGDRRDASMGCLSRPSVSDVSTLCLPPAKAGAQLGEGRNSGPRYVTATSPIGPRPSPGGGAYSATHVCL